LSTARLITSAVVGVGLLLVAVGALVARYVPISGHRTLYVVITSPYLMAAAPLALLVFLWGHRWVMAVAAVCLSVVSDGAPIAFGTSRRVRAGMPYPSVR
jgi:hypothetical protein